MQDFDKAIAALGDEPPLIGDGRAGPPDRREVSARWLSGTFLTGLTSTVLMGVALVAALDGREQLATPPEIARLGQPTAGTGGEAIKASRLAVPRSAPKARDRRRMEVSMMSRVGDRDVVRTKPFMQVKMALAAGHSTGRSYPAFDPLDVFAEDGAAAAVATTGVIYGAKVESEVSLRTVDFTFDNAFDEASRLTADEVEQVVREIGAVLSDGAVQVAALHYVDPHRFGAGDPGSLTNARFARITQENVSVFDRLSAQFDVNPTYSEDVVTLRAEKPIAEAFRENGYGAEISDGMVEALSKLLDSPNLKAGAVLRIGIESKGDTDRMVRTSLYEGKRHVLTIAVDDRDQFRKGDEPEPSPDLLAALSDSPAPTRVRGDLPTVYDGIYRAAFSYGMTRDMTRQLVKLLAAEVDFQSRLNPSDRLEVFFSEPDEEDHASEDSQLLYVKSVFGGNERRLYRFLMEDGTADYFDAEGRSARQFLLRNPVPNGKFRSGFGSRRHPILGYYRMHTGVDWSAPQGTPIIASGNGTVAKAGWAGGYGRQTIIRHANGYETSYNHQSRIANGIAPGAQVRQGQVIGYVGSTGLATGAHLHYELIVNGNKVDPMRVRLPVGRVLKDKELEAFKRERDRIDALLDEGVAPQEMAAAKIGG